jgi:hypothetical protein
MIIDGLIVVILLGAVNKEAIDSLAHVACRFFPEDIFNSTPHSAGNQWTGGPEFPQFSREGRCS